MAASFCQHRLLPKRIGLHFGGGDRETGQLFAHGIRAFMLKCPTGDDPQCNTIRLNAVTWDRVAQKLGGCRVRPQ